MVQNFPVKFRFRMQWSWLVLAMLLAEGGGASNILMMTLGGTKSHKIPFLELAHGLIRRGHNITFISAFPADKFTPHLEEVTPSDLVFYVRNFTNWDLLGSKLRNEDPVPPLEAMKFAYLACESLLGDSETKEFLRAKRHYDLIILDGAYPECALGFVYHFRAPFMYINTVGFYTYSLATAGNPAPFSVTPFFGRSFSDSMSLKQRALNTGWHIVANILHWIVMRLFVDQLLKNSFGDNIPPAYEMSRNVSFILQNGQATVSYPRPYLPNVVEVACIHCRPARPLPMDLESFISEGGEAGFIYISMGSSVRATNMPEYLRQLFLKVFAQLPYRVLWKWEAGNGSMSDLPSNVKLGAWMPQQDILGHRRLRAFVTHGGLLSMYETVFHGVPVVTMPVFCDHDSNALKAEIDGYALRLELQHLTSERLLWAINKVIHDSSYRENALRRSMLLRDQPQTPLAKAIYWTEYVIRHQGAYHLQSPAKDMSFIQYYLVDVLAIYLATLAFAGLLVHRGLKILAAFRTGAKLTRKIKKMKHH